MHPTIGRRIPGSSRRPFKPEQPNHQTKAPIFIYPILSSHIVGINKSSRAPLPHPPWPITLRAMRKTALKMSTASVCMMQVTPRHQTPAPGFVMTGFDNSISGQQKRAWERGRFDLHVFPSWHRGEAGAQTAWHIQMQVSINHRRI